MGLNKKQKLEEGAAAAPAAAAPSVGNGTAAAAAAAATAADVEMKDAGEGGSGAVAAAAAEDPAAYAGQLTGARAGPSWQWCYAHVPSAFASWAGGLGVCVCSSLCCPYAQQRFTRSCAHCHHFHTPVPPAGKYELIGVLTHKGRSVDSGHYVSWVKQVGAALAG